MQNNSIVKVTATDTEEVYPDEQGQVSIRFPWDRTERTDGHYLLLAARLPELGEHQLWYPVGAPHGQRWDRYGYKPFITGTNVTVTIEEKLP